MHQSVLPANPASAPALQGSALLGPDPFEGTAYRAVRRLGAGGMGEVFLIEHIKLGAEFVGKVLHERFAGDAALLERMRVEAQVLGRIEHPNVVSIEAFTVTRDGRPIIVMEYLEGHTLQEELDARGGALPLAEALAFAMQALSGLSVAHELGLVHRDIKPENLFLCQSSGGLLKVLDFGVARVLPTAPPGAPKPISVPTDTGVIVGTPRYLSPEGAMGQRVDHRADLYAVALVLYQMVAGRGPFENADDESASVMLFSHVQKLPLPPSHFATQAVPGELDEAILWGLKKAPAERPQSAELYRQALAQIALHLEQTPAPSSLRLSSQSAGVPGAGVASGAGARSGARVEANKKQVPEAGYTTWLRRLSPKSNRRGKVVSKVQALAFVVVAAVVAVSVAKGVPLFKSRFLKDQKVDFKLLNLLTGSR